MKTKSNKSIANFGSALIYKIVVIIVGLLLPKLFITNYGSTINGLQTSVKQIFTYIALLEAGVGASTLQSLYKPVAAGDRKTVNSYVSAASSYYNKIGVIYFVALAVMAVIYTFAVPVDQMDSIWVFVYILISGALTGINFFYVAKIKLVISAEGDQYVVSLITLATYLLSSVLKIALVYIGVSIIIVEAAYLVVNLAATAVYYFVVKRKYPWLSFKAKPDFNCVKQKGSVMVHRIASVIFQNVDIVLLTFFCNLQVVSIYSMYKMVVNMITSVVGEIGNSINFVLGQEFNSDTSAEKTKYKRIIDTFNTYYSAISFGLYTVTYILILPFLKIYTNGMDINYIYAWLPVLYIVMEFLMVGREAMMRTIEVAGHFKKTRNRTVIETVINLVASVTLIVVLKHFFGDVGGIYGALLGTIVALLYRTIDINIYANKKILNRGCIKTFCAMIINAALFVVCALVYNSITLNVTDYFRFVLYGLAITVVIMPLFIVVHSLLQPNEYKYLCNYLKTKIKKRKRT